MLQQQQSNTVEPKRLQSELVNLKGSKVTMKQWAPDLEFRFMEQVKQYELNRDIVEKIDEALDAANVEERNSKFNEGRDLLLEWKKHILFAEKYGCDTVARCTTENHFLQIQTMRSESVR